MRNVLAVACLFVSIACHGQTLSKAEAKKLIEKELAGAGALRGTLQHIYVKEAGDDTTAPDRTALDACRSEECLDAKALRDKKLVSLAASDKEGGLRKYLVVPTGDAERYVLGEATSRGTPVLAARYRVGEVTKVVMTTAAGQTSAKVFFTQRLEPTPFYGHVYLLSGEGKRSRDDGAEKVGHFSYDGRKWRRRR